MKFKIYEGGSMYKPSGNWFLNNMGKSVILGLLLAFVFGLALSKIFLKHDDEY